MLKIWKRFIEKGHARTVKAKKNVLLATLAKGIGILIGFAHYSVSLEYLSPANFGIFLTLTSIIDWFGRLDVGVGQGLRNIVGEVVADEDYDLARGYVSTAYFLLGSIISGVTLIFMLANVFIPWAEWLNADASMEWDIRILALMMFAAFGIRFVSSLVYQIFYALQRVAIVDFFSLVTKVLFLVIIIVLAYTTQESLILFGAAKTLTFALVPLFVGFYFFKREFKPFRPSIKHVRKKLLGALLTLGGKFFLIKMSMVVILQTNSILIARYVSLESVVEYQAASKFLSVFLIIFNIMSNQLWAANVEAYRKKDMEWMKKTMNGVTKIWLGSLVFISLLVLVSPIFYKLWLQDKVQISMMVSVIIAISICIRTWVNIFNLVLNGTGKIIIQMYAWIAASIMNIPISIFFATTMGLGLVGIELGTIVSLLPLVFLSPIQVRKILRGTDRGIWAK